MYEGRFLSQFCSHLVVFSSQVTIGLQMIIETHVQCTQTLSFKDLFNLNANKTSKILLFNAHLSTGRTNYKFHFNQM